MNRFTVSNDFLTTYGNDCDVLVNILMTFIQDNPYKICVDDKGKALDCYQELAMQNEYIRTWINFMGKLGFKCAERICISNNNIANEKDLFLAIASEVYPNKRLLVGSKQAYYREREQMISTNGIHLLDASETKALLSSPNITQISYGNGSPNIYGNNNNL